MKSTEVFCLFLETSKTFVVDNSMLFNMHEVTAFTMFHKKASKEFFGSPKIIYLIQAVRVPSRQSLIKNQSILEKKQNHSRLRIKESLISSSSYYHVCKCTSLISI